MNNACSNDKTILDENYTIRAIDEQKNTTKGRNADFPTMKCKLCQTHEVKKDLIGLALTRYQILT